MFSFTRSSLAIAMAALLFFISGPLSLHAGDIRVCFKNGDCFVNEGTCDGWCPGGSAFPTCTTVRPLSYASTDYLLAEKNRVWLVQGDRKIPMAPDALAAFITQMKKKYASAELKDPAVQQRISTEYSAFMDTLTSFTVSKTRLEQFARETRLRVVFKDSTYGINEPGVK